MQLIFKSNLGTHTVEVALTDTIDNVKNKLKDRTGLDVLDISLPLDGAKTVKRCKLKHDYRLNVIFDDPVGLPPSAPPESALEAAGDAAEEHIYTSLRARLKSFRGHHHQQQQHQQQPSSVQVADITVHVTLPNKKVINVTVPGDDIVFAVMDKVKQVSSVNIARHLLIHQGQSLDNRDDIQQTNLVDGSHLILQARKVELTIILPTDATCCIKVPYDAGVADVMAHIENMTNLDGTSHLLKYRGKVLSAEQKLNILKIGNNSDILMEEKKFQLHIKLQNAAKIQVQVSANANVQTVMQQIKISSAIDVAKHQLSYEGRVVQLTENLLQLNITDRSELTLQEADIHLKVCLPDSKVIPCQIPADGNVEHVISCIKRNTDLDMNGHELLYNNRTLMSTNPLKTLNIVNGAKLTLRVRRIRLRVHVLDTTIINIDVDYNETVHKVCTRLKTQRRSLQSGSFLLTYNSCTLDKNKQLHHCGVIHGAVLRVAVRDVELRVRKEDEQSIAIKLPVTDTVKLAKQKIQDRMGHRVEDQRLSIFLQDNDTLLQSNIYHNIDVQLHTCGRVKKRSTLLHASAGLNPQIQGRDKLVTLKPGGWYKGYNEDTGRWEKLIQYPEWLDLYTSGCAHPDGVILAGAGDHNTGNHVVLLNVRTKQTVPLPDLPHAVCGVGIVYNAGVLTLAGGHQFVDGQWKNSNQVYQLNVGGDGGWVKLPSLPHTPVYSPMLVCDDRYLYVLGGEECKVCVKIDKNNQHQWTTFTDLPVQCSDVRGGVLVKNNTVLVMSPSRHMTLNTHNDTWTTQEYKDNNITYCTPVWYRDKVTASVKRGDGAESVECYNSTTNTWSVLYRTDVTAGAGWFLSVKC